MSPSPEVFGPYLVYEQLGAGGMAVVHRAVQAGIEGFQKTVALKRMLPHVAANEELVRSFVREARLASYLHHSNVGQTYELGKVGDIYFIAMELLEGRNLREVLRRLASNGSLMPVPIALNIINQLCDALDYAHNLCDDGGQPLGIIHRDVSPSNVIVADDGLVKLIDFGIAKASGGGMQTMSGTIKGKFGYMAPEYIAGKIDARADLFAVGVIAHELLTNKPLFTTSDEMGTLLRVREMTIDPPSRRNPLVAPEIDDVVMTALQRDPDRRWQHATALRSAMTTLTKRLGLEVSNAQLVAWLDAFDFDMDTEPVVGAPRKPRAKSSAYADEGESKMISIEGGTAAGLPVSGDHKLTLQLRGNQPAQPDPLASPAYGAAVRQYERHDALVPSGSFLADEVVPTTVRPSRPQPAAGPSPDTVQRASAPTLLGTVDSLMAHRPSRPEVVPPVVTQTAASTAVIAEKPATSHAVAVLLVLLAAAVAAVAVYFLLPLFA